MGYRRWGGAIGYSVFEYLKVTMDFASKIDSNPIRRLNFIKAQFNKNLCANEIELIGFGSGNIQIEVEGKIEGSKFVLSPKGSKSALVISSYQALLNSNGITYEWFKSEIICKEKPGFVHCILEMRIAKIQGLK